MLLACVASVPLFASAQIGSINGLNAQYVDAGIYASWAEMSPGRWVFNGDASNVYTEVQRNETSIQLRPSNAGAKPIMFDFSKRMIYLDYNGTEAYGPIARWASTSGLSVSGIELSLFDSHGTYIGVVSLYENFTNGSSTGWTVKITAGGQTNSGSISSTGVRRTASQITLQAAPNEAPFTVDVVAGNCITSGLSCRLTKAVSVTGVNVGSMTMRSYLGLATLVQTDSTKWRVELKDMTPQVWVESNRTLDSIELTPPASVGTNKMRLYMGGRIEVAQPGNTWADNSMNTVVASADRQWKGQLGTIFEPVSPGVSPGFQIQNKTDFPVLVTLEQVGCLYYEIVQPGKVFQRNTGAVWFTIKASMAPNLEEPTIASCIRKPAMYAATVFVTGIVTAGTGGMGTALVLPAMLATAAGTGAAIGAEAALQAAGGTATEAAAGRIGVIALTRGATKVGLAILSGGAGGLVLGAALNSAVLGYTTGLPYIGWTTLSTQIADQNDIEAIKQDLVQEASVAGAYAGYPWPWKMSDRVMPRYDITGGPEVKTTPNGSTVILKQEKPLTITRVN